MLRRAFNRNCVSALGVAITSAASAVAAPQPKPKRSLRLVRTFAGGASLLDVSSDGGKLCVLFVPGGSIVRVEVLESRSWRNVYSNRFETTVHLDASFFVGGESVYVTTIAPDRGFWIDLRSGIQRERDLANIIPHTALEENVLLATRADGALVRVALPDYEVLLQSPSGLNGVVSGDRQRLIHIAGRDERIVQCFRTRDFSRLWEQRVEIPNAIWDFAHNYKGFADAAVSADGATVAFTGLDNSFLNEVKQSFVLFLDGETGKRRNVLNANGFPAMAISPDGRLVALGKKIVSRQGIELRVEVWDIPTATVVATAPHLNISEGGVRGGISFASGGKGLAFTADGIHLVSSGANRVKVWQWA